MNKKKWALVAVVTLLAELCAEISTLIYAKKDGWTVVGNQLYTQEFVLGFNECETKERLQDKLNAKQDKLAKIRNRNILICHGVGAVISLIIGVVSRKEETL